MTDTPTHLTIDTVRELARDIETAINEAIRSYEKATGTRLAVYQHMPTVSEAGIETSGRVEVEVKL